MTREAHRRFPLSVAGLTLALILSAALAHAESDIPDLALLGQQDLPNMGQQITPLAPQGSRFLPMNPDLPDNPAWLAGQAVTTVVSPDRKTLLVLTSGYNRFYNTNSPPPALPPFYLPPWYPADSNEYVFIYDISTHTPVNKQVVQIPNTYNGIVFDPSGWAFYVAGGVDDNVHIITRSATGTWGEQPGNELALGHHNLGVGLDLTPNGAIAINAQVGVHPCAAGVAISNDGKTLVVANYYNDSITVFNGGYGNWSKLTELDLRPGKNSASQAGVPGGEYPFWVVVKGNGSSATAYVSSIRDREIVVINLSGAPAVATRIKVKGQPNKMTLNAAQSLLYVVEDQSDTIDVIDTTKNAILETIPVLGPASVMPSLLAQYTGANPNSVTLSPDEKQLYVTNGNLNCIAVVALGGANSGDQVVGLIPTGWYPNSVSFSGDGSSVYVVNGKSPTGPNPGWCYGAYGPPNSPTCLAANQYNLQLIKAGFQSFPRPSTAQLMTLTAQVAANNRFSSTESAGDAAVMAAVRQGVQHVIFIIKENRTYDQILGDLEIGNGDPDLAHFGQAVTPNQHNLARTFVTLDNFLDTAECSYDGWLWTTSARAPDVVERQLPVAYSVRGLSLDSEGVNRNVNVAIPTLDGRRIADPFTLNDPDVLPGQTNVAAPDGPNNEVNTGYLWDSALRANLTVRSYGFFVDTTRYSTADYTIPVVRDPFSTGTVVAFPSSASLALYTDPFFRGFDNSLPDYYRYKEWEREFDTYYANESYAEGARELEVNQAKERSSEGARELDSKYGNVATDEGGRLMGRATLPALSLVRFMHDHTGNFKAAIDRVNTPELQVADNDYAVGLLVQKIANSRYANNTLIFVIEDDSQDGGDHVDSHRSVAFVAGAYVKQGALVSTQYNTIDFVRTIEEVLDLPPLNLNDALARPMADIFNKTPSPWSFTATPSAFLYNTDLPLPPKLASLIVPKPTHDAKYWARVTKGMDFTAEDRFDFATYNRVLWTGLMGNRPYPVAPTGVDLRQNREKLLERYQTSLSQEASQAPNATND
jgi:DNA-binding beta-propeller fold protein YncE